VRRLGSILARLMALAALVAGSWWWWQHAWGGAEVVLAPIAVEVTALDVIDAFDRGDATVRIVHQSEEMPLRAVAFASLDKSTELASDQDAKVIHARAESAFEVTVGPLAEGARLVAQTFVHTANRRDPALADPAPTTFRILVDGEERASISSAYVRDVEGHSHPYDQLMRTLEVSLDEARYRTVTLRFETTRGGEPMPELPPGLTPSEPVWWQLVVRHPVEVPRQRAGRQRPNILVLVVDTLGAGHTMLGGYERATTPEISAFATQGTVFSRAIAPSSWTLPSIASLLTGLPPNTHGVLGDERSYLMDGLTTWPELLRQAGIEGAAFVANTLIQPANNFDQGFGTWVQADDERAESLNGRLLDWVDGQPDDARWFAYVHYMDPHAPYDAPGADRERYTGDYVEQRDFRGFLPNQLQREEVELLSPDEKQHVVDLYDGEVAYFDRCFGELIDQLNQRSLLEHTFIALTADHGEELFEHGGLGHGYSLHDEVLSVPLILAGPKARSGAHVDQPVSTASLASTLALLAGIELGENSAPPLLKTRKIPTGPVYSTVRTQLFGPREVHLSGQDAAGRKVIVVLDEQGATLSVRHYDSDEDPGENKPVNLARLPLVERTAHEALLESSLRWHADSAARRPAAPQQPLSTEMIDAFRRAGYTGDEAGASDESDDDGN
jgi:arylsulfatase